MAGSDAVALQVDVVRTESDYWFLAKSEADVAEVEAGHGQIWKEGYVSAVTYIRDPVGEADTVGPHV
jgi:hypothetical protein